MDLRATLCPDRLLPRASSIFYRPRSLTALLIVAHFKIHAEHNWLQTWYVYNEASPQTDELRTVCENSAHLSVF